MNISELSIRRPVLATVLTIIILLFGFIGYNYLGVREYPSVDNPIISVSCSYPGANADVIENQITEPLEQNINGIPGIRSLSSVSQQGQSRITVEFELSVDLETAANDVRDKVSRAQRYLPRDCDPPTVSKADADAMPILMVALQSDKRSLLELSEIADLTVKEQLQTISDVSSVSIWGEKRYSMRLWLDPVKMAGYGITPIDVKNAVDNENVELPSGSIEGNTTELTIRTLGLMHTADEFNDLIIKEENNRIVRFSDIGRAELGPADIKSYMKMNGVPMVGVVVIPQPGANHIEIADAVYQRMEQMKKDLPEDVHYNYGFDNTKFIRASINEVKSTVYEAFVLVIIIIFLFLRDWRVTLVPCIVIPVSLIGAFFVMYLAGFSINVLSMLAIVLSVGLVVDDAIVVLENVTTHIERGSDPKQAAVHGTNEVAISVIASTLTMIAVFFPLTMVSGMCGVLFKQLGWMMCAIMFVSTVAALSLTPMLCSQLLRLQKRPSKMFKLFFTPIEKALDGLDTGYAKMLNWAVRHRPIVIVSCIAFFVVSLLCAKGIGTEFFPAQDNARIAVQLELPIGTRKEIAQELSEKLTNQWLTKYKDIMKVCNYTVGQADSDNTWASMQDNGSHIISFNISLVDPGDRDISLETVCDEMRQDLKAYPEFSKAQVILGGSNTGMSAQASADFEIYGYDMTTTDSVAARLKRELLNVKGVTEVNISRSDYQPEYQVDFDREKLAMHGLNLATAGNYLRNRINGAVASKYREDGDEYDIKVRYAPEYRTSLESLENILIYNAKGESVRVKDVGKVVERFAPPTIERKDRERIVTVSAVISGAPLGDVVAAGNKIIDKMELPGEVTIQISGSFEDQQDSFRDLGTLGILIVILVFIVMAAQFESLTYPFIIMFSLPFAFSGVLMALFFTGSTLSVMSLLGGIMLIGIVVKNGIVLIDYITLCRERGMAVINSVVTSGKSRLRPVLMTTATTVLGMIPMAIGGGQGSEMWSPMAIAVIGGLTISTILTLILIPTLYCVFAGTGIKNRRRKLHRQRELDVYFQEHKDEIIKK